MNNWTLFSDLFSQIDAPLRATVSVIIEALTGYLRPALLAGLIAYIAGKLLWLAIHPQSAQPMSETEGLLFKGAVAMYLATNAAAYEGTVRDLLLYGVPNEISQRLSGASGTQPINGAVFDDIANKAWLAGMAVYDQLSWSDLAIRILVVLYWIVAIAAVLVAFLVWLKAFAMLSLLIAVGPLFVGLFVFPILRGLFMGWLRTVFTNILLQILVVALLSILLGVERQLVGRIATQYQAGGNVMMQAQMLLLALTVFVACAWIALQLPYLAAAICGGFAADSVTTPALGKSFGLPAVAAGAGGAARLLRSVGRRVGAGAGGLLSGQSNSQQPRRNTPPDRAIG